MKLTWVGSMFVIIVGILFSFVEPTVATETTLVVCAPGYPGSTAEAQPAMDNLASVLALATGQPVTEFGAVYFENENAGVEALRREDAAVALVTLPFFLEHRDALALSPLVQAVPTGRTANEAWTLVAGTGRIGGPGDLNGWKIESLGGHSRTFVLAAVFDGWGAIPDDVEILFSNRVLTSLKRASKGEKVAVLLDAQQAQSLDRLPFAKDLDVVRETDVVPTSLLCAVGDRLSPKNASDLVDAALALSSDESAATALAGVRLVGFVPLDDAALGRANSAFDRAKQ